jgi:hypothetical protein
MTELEIFMEGLEGGINSSKGPPWKWDKVVMVMEEAKRIGEKPGAPYPVTQEAWETGWWTNCIKVDEKAHVSPPLRSLHPSGNPQSTIAASDGSVDLCSHS